MLADLLTSEQFIHLFPSLFAIFLCFISKLDHYWIDWKVQSELGGGATPNAALIASAKQIANGSAALNIHLINFLLFIAGAVFAVFDWPTCMAIWPLVICIILFAITFYEVLITGFRTRFDAFDRDPVEQSKSQTHPNPTEQIKSRLGRWFRNRPVSAQLRWEQIAFNVIVVILVVAGVMLGGAKDHRGFCKRDMKSPVSSSAATTGD